jgi:putative transposase
MITILSALVSLLSFRVRSRASLELELVALRHQVAVLRRQHKGRLQLFSTDRLLWVWLYRIWPKALNTIVLVKPTTMIQWHRKGFRLYWRWRSRPLGRPKMGTEIRDLIRRMSLANPVHGEFVITLQLASGTDRGNGVAKRSDQGRHGWAAVRQIFLLECCH